MVILITGASHTGKTLLAQRMLEKFTEYLWPIVREMVKTAIENRQNLIVEGCYIPTDWRKDFSEQYLQSIRFICLAMSDAYIEAHFEEIRNHASAIETRLYDTDNTIKTLKFDNHYYIDAFTRSGEQIAIIEKDFWQTLNELCFE